IQIKHLLEIHNYKVSVSRDGKQAMDWLSNHKPSLVISDIVMPEMNGYELCTKIKSNKNTEDIPVILLTRLSDPEEIIEGLSCGADSFITKPYNEKYLLSHIEKILSEENGTGHKKVPFGVQILFKGKKRFIQAEQQNVIKLMINIYEGAIHQNDRLVQTEEELRLLNEQLKSLVKELEAFTYSVSHDLRAPLRAIDGYSKFILEDYGTKLDSEGERLLGLIRSNTQKMDQLITDLLALSKITRSELNLSNINMTEMAMSMFNETASPVIRKKLNITIDTLPEVYADPSYIKQVWINLISNAIKFSSRKKKPQIKISGNTENGFHIYYIKDNGVGFNQEYAHKLFGVFQRLHKVDEFEGTGVGLAIVQRIIHKHSGKVWAQGKEGSGAIFYFSLPVE
ncbi:MAG: hybrid sensor histidine kinase/response regulator, partial [Bacteroidetes bacterium]